jgi:hypothetical protein
MSLKDAHVHLLGSDNCGIVMVTFFFGFVAILLVVAVSLGGLVYVRKRVRIATLVKNHEVADPLLSVVGTLFAILLGF